MSKKLISIPDMILIHFSLSFSRIQHIAGLPNLFYWNAPQLREKSYCGPHAFLPRNSGLFLAALMAKTNVRPFYLPENGKPFHKEIKRAKRPLRATGWAALEYSLSKAHVLPLGKGISEYYAISELFQIARTES